MIEKIDAQARGFQVNAFSSCYLFEIEGILEAAIIWHKLFFCQFPLFHCQRWNPKSIFLDLKYATQRLNNDLRIATAYGIQHTTEVKFGVCDTQCEWGLKRNLSIKRL